MESDNRTGEKKILSFVGGYYNAGGNDVGNDTM
jgi:hypothetical protein